MPGEGCLTREEAEALVYRECQLLDERRLDEWLQLFTKDGVYWLPSSESPQPGGEVPITYDDPVQRAKRVHQLIHESHLAQTPPSRTVHLVSNVQVDQGAGKEAVVRCSLLVAEVRPGLQPAALMGAAHQRLLAGHCAYHLRYEGERWAIALKKVLLIDRDLPLYNLSFLI